MQAVIETLTTLMSHPKIKAAVIIAGSIGAAYIVSYILNRTLVVFAKRTKTGLDDVVLEATRYPIFLSVVLIGLFWSSEVALTKAWSSVVIAILKTIAIIVWCFATLRISSALLDSTTSRSGLFQRRTVPIFDMVGKIFVVGAGIYFVFLAWDIDVTAWLASAGIVGIAVGFAAKDTLANLFSGIFIVADAPYKVGDFIVLDGDLRGQVTRIGMRSTRILTRDDIEITIPNAVIGNSKIINEAGGPHVKQRMGITVYAAYGSDIDQVREVLSQCTSNIDGISPAPSPQIRFREMADSGLRFELLVWIDDPAERGQVVDALNCAVYKAFKTAGLEIPYPKRDLYIRQMPDRLS